MKPNYFYQLLFALFVSSTAAATEHIATEPIVISGTKFTYPLIERWILEYSKIKPDVKIKISSKGGTQTPELNVIAHRPAQTELQSDQKVIYAGKYALLPVTNVNNPNLPVFTKNGLSKKEIDKLFFEVIDYDSDEPIQKSKYPATIYARDNKACTSAALAAYFGHSPSEIRGKKVFGDDIHLLSALKKDSISLTYNALSYLYDINTRSLKSGLAILPVDLKKDTKVILTGSLDEVINTLEKTQVETIPVENIGFVLNRQSERPEVSEFLKWVLSEGQKFNHEEGFLALDKNQVLKQVSTLSERFLSQK